MAITPRSKGLGNIGAIVNRQGQPSPTQPTVVAPKATPVNKATTTLAQRKAAPSPFRAQPKPVAKPITRPQQPQVIPPSYFPEPDIIPEPTPQPQPVGPGLEPVYEPFPNRNIFDQPNMPGGKGGFPGGGQIQQPAFIGQGGTPEQWNQFNQGNAGGMGMVYTDPYGGNAAQQAIQSQTPQPFNPNPNPVSNMGAGQMPQPQFNGQLDLSGMMGQQGQPGVPTSTMNQAPQNMAQMGSSSGGKSSSAPSNNASYGGGKSR